MTHKLVNIKYNPDEPKKLRKWSGSCKCGRWNGMGSDKKDLKKLWNISHLKELM